MAAEEIEVTLEIVCTHLPGEEWDGQRTLSLGIQRGNEMVEPASAGSKRVVFQPVLRARRNTDGSANFLGEFAHGPRTERFIYLIWAVIQGPASGRMVGRIKLHLNHIKWATVEKTVGGKKPKPIRVTLDLTNAKGKPVMASVRPDAAKWELA
jgi:hypothetical protein